MGINLLCHENNQAQINFAFVASYWLSEIRAHLFAHKNKTNGRLKYKLDYNPMLHFSPLNKIVDGKT